MASVDNQYCVRILAICLTAQIMLITQVEFSFLGYVQRYKIAKYVLKINLNKIH